MSAEVYTFECRRCGPVTILRDQLATHAAQPCPNCGAPPGWRLVRCECCQAEIEGDARRTGHLGGWRSASGDPCSNPGGHLPKRLTILPPPGH